MVCFFCDDYYLFLLVVDNEVSMLIIVYCFVCIVIDNF